MPRKSNAERRSKLKHEAAQNLRAAATDTERLLWTILRNRRFGGVRFRRQQPIGPYIVDFYCSVMKLVVELDGSQHGDASAVAYDDARTRWLEKRGYRVLRFWNEDFMRNPDPALDAIWRAVKEKGFPSPKNPSNFSTLHQGEGDRSA